ncbi:MAG: TIM barrel protein [Candidatus Thorarchaeota archaeon]|nr:TIM barrel protein [Candidatus Thorarchaeota archaeon]
MYFGPSGYPEEAKGSADAVFALLRDAGLNALEYAAVYGLRINEEKARLVGDLSKATGVQMSMHAAYYISLASKDPAIRERSKYRLVQALTFAPLMNVKRVVFHPGTYGGLDAESAFVTVRDALSEVWHTAGKSAHGTFLAPETAGKTNNFGSIEEVIRLCSELEYCIPTVDWAHLYARTKGEMGDSRSYREVLSLLEESLGDRFLKNMHFHVSGIVYGEKGEKEHRPLGGEWGPDILPLIQLCMENGYNPTFISETPEPIEGALYIKHLVDQLERSKQ